MELMETEISFSLVEKWFMRFTTPTIGVCLEQSGSATLLYYLISRTSVREKHNGNIETPDLGGGV